MGKREFVLIATAMMLLTAMFLKAQSITTKDLGVQTIFQHRDTKLLDLNGSALTGKHSWDLPHEVKSVDDVASCDICNKYCGFASIAMINHYYGGNLSEDRLAYYKNTIPDMMGPYLKHPEGDLWHGGIDPGEATKTLSWSLNNASIYRYDGKPTLDQLKQWIDQNRPILTLVPGGTGGGHFVVTSGYDGQYLIMNDPWLGTKNRILYDEVTIGKVWVPPSNATARSDEPTIWKDSDYDGIVDFDETRRFFTDPYSNDTDKDGIPDKTEIRSYTFLSDDTFDSEDVRKPDADNDGLRAELDFDSDNGGTPDCLEDLNKNGKIDSGETDPFNPEDDPYIPPPVALFEYTPEIAWVNESIFFNASKSYDPDGTIISYEWNFGDGNIRLFLESLQGLPFSYRFYNSASFNTIGMREALIYHYREKEKGLRLSWAMTQQHQQPCSQH